MQLTILGRYGATPAVNGACSSYLVRSENAKILLDCGSGAVSRLQNYCKLDELDAIILSHLHFDHTSDMLPLGYYYDLRGESMTVYLPFTEGVEFAALTKFPCYKLNPIKDGGTVQIKDISISFHLMQHKQESYATRLECNGRVLVYSGDTEMNPNIAPSIKGADVYLADCSIPTAAHSNKYSHMSVSQGAAAAKAEGCKLIVTHLFGNLLNSSEVEGEYERAEVAEEGKTYTI